MTVCIYTIGDQANGFGHVMRELVLAGELRRRGVEVMFVTPANTPGADRLKPSGFATFTYLEAGFPPEAETLIVDVEHGPQRIFLESVRPYFKNLITVCGSGYSVDDPAAVEELSDLIVEQNPFGNGGGHIEGALTGLPYIMVDPRYADLAPDPDGPIVLSLGGADPYGVTQPIANALGAAGYSVTVVVGPAAAEPDIRNGQPEIVRAPDSLLTILDGASVLVGALGMTAYEAAAAGVPMLLTAWTSDHERTARFFGERGAAITLGLAASLNDAVITEMVGDVATLKTYPPVWESMSRYARDLCDGQGVKRVAEALMALIEHSHKGTM